MPNENEHPRYSDPDHPYSGSGLRYQNNYNRNEYHAGDGPFQFPWWAIVIGFVVWWPLGFIFIGLNAAMKNGKLAALSRKPVPGPRATAAAHQCRRDSSVLSMPSRIRRARAKLPPHLGMPRKSARAWPLPTA